MIKKEIVSGCELYLSSMEEVIPTLEKVDCIFTDPPYLYLKNHEFDKQFDENLLFENAKRLLPDNGFIALFGRGTSFYRWNTVLAKMGFIFKEEIIWDKHRTSGVSKSISRVHETISLHTKKSGVIKQVYIPYEEMREGNYSAIKEDVKRILGALENSEKLKKLENYLETKSEVYEMKQLVRYKTGYSTEYKINNFCARLKFIEKGIVEKSIISLPRTIVAPVHPTEKPVRLAERIITLISDPGDIIYDPFMGSGSFGEACLNTGRKYIGSEINPEYFEIACNRLKNILIQTSLFEDAE